MRISKSNTVVLRNGSGGPVLKTADDVVFVWKAVGDLSGWSRVTQAGAVDVGAVEVLLVPKRANPALTAAALDTHVDAFAEGFQDYPVLFANNPEDWDFLAGLRRARVDRDLIQFYSAASVPERKALLVRLSVAEILVLVQTFGLDVAVDALRWSSLPAREALLRGLGRRRVALLVNGEFELPVELSLQIMRSDAFDASGVVVTAESAAGVAGNATVQTGQQVTVVDALIRAYVDGDEQVVTPLSRALGSAGLAAEAARVAVREVASLPHRALMALASNQAADWLWLRQVLDGHDDPVVAEASAGVGELSPVRLAVLRKHSDPVVRKKFTGEMIDYSGVDAGLVADLLFDVDDPFSDRVWSFRPGHVDDLDHGSYVVSRYWAAIVDDFGDAEADLRELVSLHNRAWGQVGAGTGDPVKAAKMRSAQAASRFNSILPRLGFEPGVSVNVDEARLAVVQAVAVDPDRFPEGPLKAAVYAAVSAELLAEEDVERNG